jgi:hypothetical protein
LEQDSVDEILANTAKVRDLLKARAIHQMSPEEFREQKRSFVIGNAFDAFANSDTITRTTMEAADLDRLKVAS